MEAGGIRQALVRALDDVEVTRHAPAQPGPGEALVRTVLAGICGSDVHATRGTHPFIRLPFEPGYEVVGVVERVGEDVSAPAPGDRVALEPNLACGRCEPCLAGRYNICGHLDVFGCQTRGGMADSFVVAADLLHVLPDGLSDEAAVLIEPPATPPAAVAEAGDLTGRRVLVLGAVPVGLFCMLATRRAGAAAEAVAEGGQVVLVGVEAPEGSRVRTDLVQDEEIRLDGSLMYVGRDFRAAMQTLRSARYDASEMITARFPLDQAAVAFAAAADPAQAKVVVAA